MDKGICAKRRAIAHERIEAASAQLAALAGVANPVLPLRGQDKDVAYMKQLEQIAFLLESMLPPLTAMRNAPKPVAEKPAKSETP